MKVRRSRRWLVLCGAICAAVLVAVLIALLPQGHGGGVRPTSIAPGPGTASPTSIAGGGTVVEPGVAKRGWVPEPITQDVDVYARAALEAAASFDTRRSTRQEWLTWLGSWFTPSPLYDNQRDALDQLARYQAELAQTVVPPPSQWDDLTKNAGQVTARVEGPIDYLNDSDAAQKHVRTATANVVVTFTQTGDGAGGNVSYDQTVRVSVQLVCGGESVPTPDSSQRAGDCKVVRFFDTAVG